MIDGENHPSSAGASLRRVLGRALDAVLPHQCLACGGLIGEGGGILCPDCWDRVAFHSPPWCSICGLPFEFDMGAGAVCGACARRPPAYRRARAAFAYDDASRRLLLAFKHGDRTDAAPAYGRLLLSSGRELLSDIDWVAPVPLHWTRLFSRRYNQAALLAREVASGAGLTLVPDLLVRRRRTPPQGHMTVRQRRDNVRGAFVLGSGRDVVGRRVLLIDDVMTTGATIEACARCLTEAGAAAVDVLTLARVVVPASGSDV